MSVWNKWKCVYRYFSIEIAFFSSEQLIVVDDKFAFSPIPDLKYTNFLAYLVDVWFIAPLFFEKNNLLYLNFVRKFDAEESKENSIQKNSTSN